MKISQIFIRVLLWAAFVICPSFANNRFENIKKDNNITGIIPYDSDYVCAMSGNIAYDIRLNDTKIMNINQVHFSINGCGQYQPTCCAINHLKVKRIDFIVFPLANNTVEYMRFKRNSTTREPIEVQDSIFEEINENHEGLPQNQLIDWYCESPKNEDLSCDGLTAGSIIAYKEHHKYDSFGACDPEKMVSRLLPKSEGADQYLCIKQSMQGRYLGTSERMDCKVGLKLLDDGSTSSTKKAEQTSKIIESIVSLSVESSTLPNDQNKPNKQDSDKLTRTEYILLFCLVSITLIAFILDKILSKFGFKFCSFKRDNQDRFELPLTRITYIAESENLLDTQNERNQLPHPPNIPDQPNLN